MGQMGCRSGDSLRLAALWNYLCCGSSDGAGLFRTVRPSGQNLLVCLFWGWRLLYLYCQCAPDALLTVRWQKVALLSLAVFVLGLGHVGKYFRPQWSKQYEQPRQDGTLRILSYNVGGFWGNVPESRRVACMRLPLT